MSKSEVKLKLPIHSTSSSVKSLLLFDAYINLGNVHQTLFESEEAVSAALKALEINPKAAIAYNNLGTSLGDLNHIEEARQAYITANLIDKNNVSSLNEYTLKNLKRIREYINQGVLSVEESIEDKLEKIKDKLLNP